MMDASAVGPLAAHVRHTARVAALLAALTLAVGAPAAPVDGSASPVAPADPNELALRWTLSGITPLAPALPPPAAAAAEPKAVLPPSFGRLPAPGTDAGVPDPAGYAAMGLALVVVGLAVRHWRRGTGGARRPHRR